MGNRNKKSSYTKNNKDAADITEERGLWIYDTRSPYWSQEGIEKHWVT